MKYTYNITIAINELDDIWASSTIYHLQKVIVRHLDWSPIYKSEHSKELDEALRDSMARWRRIEIKKAAAEEIKKLYGIDYHYNQLNLVSVEDVL